MMRFLQTLIFAAIVFFCGALAGSFGLVPLFGVDDFLISHNQTLGGPRPRIPLWLYEAKMERQRTSGAHADAIALGDSLTEEGGDWNEWVSAPRVLNRGISGELSDGMLARLDEIIARKPRVVSLLAGTNDLLSGWGEQHAIANIRAIAAKLKAANIAVVLTTVPFVAHASSYKINEEVLKLNALIRAASVDAGAPLVDLNSMTAKEGALDPEKTYDGLHFRGGVYRQWGDALTPVLQKLLAAEAPAH